jgi:hypothetical protein
MVRSSFDFPASRTALPTLEGWAMLLAFHHRTSLCLGICLLVIKQAFYHPGLFLPGHGILAITLKVSQCDRAVVFFIDQSFSKIVKGVSSPHVIDSI